MSGYLAIILHTLVWCLGRIEALQKFASQPYNSTLHSAMPDLFALDDYERCLSRPHAYYCVMDLSLADLPGQPYDNILEYSAVSNKHYNRTRLHRGACVSERCNLDSHGGVPAPDELLPCMNRTVFRELGVQVGQANVQYCHSADESLPAPDALDILVAIVLSMLVLSVAAGTLNHFFLDAGLVKGNPYWMAFSAINNWQVLKSERTFNGSEMFPALQGMRFLTMLIIMIVHVTLFCGYTFTRNPEYIEQSYDHPLRQMLANGSVVVQTFFVMSGFLHTQSFFKSVFPKTNVLGFIFKSILDRCMRLLPTVLVMVGLSATWIPRAGSGPLWNLLVRQERDICRAGWWRNLLFVQNYFAFDKFCLMQSWYLAADTQLYALGLLLMLVLCRYQQRARLLFGTVLAVSLAVPALQTYFQNLQPVRVSICPETILKLFVDNKTFINAYISTQANWTGYTLGMLTAYIHHQARMNTWDLRNSTVLRRLFYLSLPVALGALWYGSEFHSRPPSQLESAAFNSLDRNFFAAAMCVFILGCINKCDKVLRGCVEWAPLQPLGRLSFCAMVLHMHVLRTYMGHIPWLQHLSTYSLVVIWLGVSVITFVLSLVMFLLVEQPFEQLRKLLFSSKNKSFHDNKQRSKIE